MQSGAIIGLLELVSIEEEDGQHFAGNPPLPDSLSDSTGWDKQESDPHELDVSWRCVEVTASLLRAATKPITFRFHDRRITAYVVELFEVVTGGHTRQYPPAYPLLEPISFLPFPRDGLDVLFEACGVPLPMAIGPMAELGMSAPGDDRRHPCPCPSSPSAPAPNDWVTECGYDPLGKRTQAAHLGDRLAGFLPNAPNRLGTVSNPALAAGPPIDPPIAAYKHLGPGRLAQQDTPTIPGSPTTTTTSVGSPNPPTSATPTDSLTAAFASVPANR